MQAKHFILPAAALVLAGVLVGGQRKRISELHSGNVELRGRIAAAGAADAPSDPKRPDRHAPDGQAIDWDKLASQLREQHPDGADREMLSIQRRLLAMDSAELLASLDRIAAMELDDETRDKLEILILDPLCKKDPEAALERFKGRLGEQSGISTYFLSSALKDWAKRDLVAATAWLDREIVAGSLDPKSLDGKSLMRTRLESAVVFGIFAADPAKAEARLSNLPAAMRAEILGQADSFHKMGKEDEIAFAEIVRRQLDEKGRVSAISERAKKVIGRGGDFAAVDEYLNSVYAAPDERERSAESAARQYSASLGYQGKLSAAKIDALRAWAGRDAPESVDQLTSEALIDAVKTGGSMDISEGLELAERYHETAGSDVVISYFLNNIDPKENKAGARKLAEKISDPEVRGRILERFE